MRRILMLVFGIVLFFTVVTSEEGYCQIDQRIVFSRNISGNWDVWIFNPDNGELQQVTNTVKDEINPVWLNGKKNIAYLREGNIYRVNHKKEIQLTVTGNYRYLSYNRKWGKILFSKFIEPEEAEIGYIEPNTREEGIIFTRAKQQISPVSSPDGQRVYFMEGYLERNSVVLEIWEFGRLNNNFKLLSKKDKTAYFRPALSADGQKLVFVEKTNDNMVLCTRNLVTGAESRIEKTEASYIDYPCWSEDGGRILYTSLVENQTKLVIYDLSKDNTIVVPIPGECKESQW